jgi:hypothetical protein
MPNYFMQNAPREYRPLLRQKPHGGDIGVQVPPGPRIIRLEGKQNANNFLLLAWERRFSSRHCYDSTGLLTRERSSQRRQGARILT